MSDDIKLATVDERSATNTKMITAIFKSLDYTKIKTWYISGAVAVIFVVFSILAGVYQSKQSYILGKVDAIQEAANGEGKKIVARLTAIETGIKHSTKANEEAHTMIKESIDIKKSIDKLEKMNIKMERYTQDLVRGKVK